jgi:hypothetical protein
LKWVTAEWNGDHVLNGGNKEWSEEDAALHAFNLVRILLWSQMPSLEFCFVCDGYVFVDLCRSIAPNPFICFMLGDGFRDLFTFGSMLPQVMTRLSMMML